MQGAPSAAHLAGVLVEGVGRNGEGMHVAPHAGLAAGWRRERAVHQERQRMLQRLRRPAPPLRAKEPSSAPQPGKGRPGASLQQALKLNLRPGLIIHDGLHSMARQHQHCPVCSFQASLCGDGAQGMTPQGFVADTEGHE